MNKVIFFLINYIKSMRLYYAFITGISGWVGVSYYQYLHPDYTNNLKNIYILIMLFLSWGINQVINDFLGLKEDKINAPHRPMVTGDLKIKPALLFTFFLLLLMSTITYFLNPLALIPAIIGILLNIFYEYAKALSLLGNLVFGIMIAMCPIYGFLASGSIYYQLGYSTIIPIILIIIFLNGLMTFYTYFKDYIGDKKAGKKTFIVKNGINVSKYVGLILSLVPIIMVMVFLYNNLIPTKLLYNKEFIFCNLVTCFLLIWNAIAYFKNPIGEKTYFNLVINIRACCTGHCALISIYNGELALYLLMSSYIFIGFLFNFYTDKLS